MAKKSKRNRFVKLADVQAEWNAAHKVKTRKSDTATTVEIWFDVFRDSLKRNGKTMPRSNARPTFEGRKMVRAPMSIGSAVHFGI